jgi:hypothetical protein
MRRAYNIANAQGVLSGVIRTRAPFFWIGATPVGRDSTITLYVAGSYRAVQTDSIAISQAISVAGMGLNGLVRLSAQPDAGWFNYGGIAGAAGQYADFPTTYQAGDYYAYAAANQNCFVQVLDANSGNELFKLTITAGVAANGMFRLPAIPLKINLVTAVINTSYNLVFNRAGADAI